MKPIKTHTFAGVKYHIDIDPDKLDGVCWIPDDKGAIFIFKPLETKLGLETAIHEAIHALCPQVKEPEVEKLGFELAKWLWRLGYRMENK